MSKNLIIVVADYSQTPSLSFEEICEICQISPDFIHELVAYGVIQPVGEQPDEWLFDMGHLQRIKSALRLRRDLDVNLAGIAVILDLLEEMERLRKQNELFHKHYFSF